MKNDFRVESLLLCFLAKIFCLFAVQNIMWFEDGQRVDWPGCIAHSASFSSLPNLHSEYYRRPLYKTLDSHVQSSIGRALNMAILHPLDPLTAGEVTKISSIVKQHEEDQALRFKHIAIIEPPESLLREYLTGERSGSKDFCILPRKALALYYHRGTSNWFLASINLSWRRVEKAELLDSRYHAQNDVDEVVMMRNLCLNHPKILEAVEKLDLPKGSILVADTWQVEVPSSFDWSLIITHKLQAIWSRRHWSK